MKDFFVSVFLTVMLGLSNLYGNDIKVFKKGFTVGLEAVEYQLNNEGFEPRIIDLDSPYIVMLDINKVATSDILYFQHLLNKDGIDSLITRKFLLIKAFDRLPDAKELARVIYDKYQVKVRVKELTDGRIETYPILFKNTFEPLIDKIASSRGKTIIKQYKTPIKIRLENEKRIRRYNEMTKGLKYFSLNNQAMSFSYDYPKRKPLSCGNNFKNCFESSSFHENKIFNKNKKFKKGGVYVTRQGEVFQKVHNKNIFFELHNIK